MGLKQCICKRGCAKNCRLTLETRGQAGKIRSPRRQDPAPQSQTGSLQKPETMSARFFAQSICDASVGLHWELNAATDPDFPPL